MRNIFMLSLLLIMSSTLFAQDYMDVIAKQSCDCIENMPDISDQEELNMKLGLCMIEACWAYKDELKRDYGIDMDRIDVEGEKLGRIIGVKIALTCPELMMKISRMVSGESGEKESFSVKGTITKVEDDFFVVFSLKDESGKVSKYYWLTFFDSDMELTGDYKNTKGKSVIIDYETMELFDPKIEQYRPFNIIVGMTFNN